MSPKKFIIKELTAHAWNQLSHVCSDKIKYCSMVTHLMCTLLILADCATLFSPELEDKVHLQQTAPEASRCQRLSF